MVRKNAWYKREPWRVLSSYRSLTLAEKGVANVILDMIYMEQGSIDLDYAEIHSWCGSSNLETVTKCVDRLIDKGKFHLDDDGKLTNRLAAFSIEISKKSTKKSMKKSIENPRNLKRKRSKNKGVDDSENKNPKTDSERESLSLPRERDSLVSDSDLPQAAVERLGALAAAAGTIPELTLQSLLEGLVSAECEVINRRGETWVRFISDDPFIFGFCANNHSGELRAQQIEVDRK